MDLLLKVIEKLTLVKAKVAGIAPVAPKSSLPKLPELPTHKPVSPPSMTPPPTPKKLPGEAPSSGKDPKKVADQLKSGQPPKPKIKQQMLKFDTNGQWSLEDLE